MTVIARLVAVAILAAAASLAVPGPAAYAAPCSGGSGVTVVVDFNSLGGGVQQGCVSGGGGDAASSLFPAAGFPLSYAARQPGFVCRVKGVPTSDPCQNTAPATAFWSLWWSDGSGSWTYSSIGAGSLKVPDGGFVAFSWDDVSGTAPPSADPQRATPPSSPDPTTPSGPGNDGPADPGGDNGQPAAPGSTAPPAGSPSSSPDASPSDKPGRRDGKGDRGDKDKKPPKATPSATPTAPETTAPVEESEPGGVATEPPVDSDGLPGWVAPSMIAVMFAAAGVALLVRRRRSGL